MYIHRGSRAAAKPMEIYGRTYFFRYTEKTVEELARSDGYSTP